MVSGAAIVAAIIVLLAAHDHVHVHGDDTNSTIAGGNATEAVHHGQKQAAVPRIVGGIKAEHGQFYGIVSLQSRRGEHFCGGTLVEKGNSTFIITAAHCMQHRRKSRDPRTFRVMADDTSIAFERPPGSRRQYRSPKKVIVHPEFDEVDGTPNDIAIIILAEPFTYTKTFGPISLPTHDVVDYANCTVAGWGTLTEKGILSIDIQYVNVSIVPRLVCNGRYRYRGVVSPRAFCAGSREGGRDSCQGDSGGGFICEGHLSGVVSFGLGCGNSQYPGVYTNVYRYKNWITENASSVNGPTLCVILIGLLFFYLI